MTHEHDFVPVSIQFKRLQSFATDGIREWDHDYQGPNYGTPRFVWLACACGAVKKVETKESDK